MKTFRREQITALASLLVMMALFGHSLYHSLDYEHYHPHHSHHQHDGHHDSHHDSLPGDSHHHDDTHHDSLPDDGDPPREVAKCELFSLLALSSQNGLVLERIFGEAVLGRQILWSGRQAVQSPNSRAPPQPV